MCGTSEQMDMFETSLPSGSPEFNAVAAMGQSDTTSFHKMIEVLYFVIFVTINYKKTLKQKIRFYFVEITTIYEYDFLNDSIQLIVSEQRP